MGRGIEWDTSRFYSGTTPFSNIYIYINELDCGIIRNILKFANDTKIYGKVGTNKGIEELREDWET